MRLLGDPQPAIEWLCTGGSVCIGVEKGPDETADMGVRRDVRVRVASKTGPVPFPVQAGEA